MVKKLLPYLHNIVCDQIYITKPQMNKHKSHHKTAQHKPRSCSGAISEKSRQSNPVIGEKEIVRKTSSPMPEDVFIVSHIFVSRYFS